MALSETDLQQFKSQLIKQRIEVIKAVETGLQSEETVELDQARVGRLSRMDAMQAQAMSRETGRRLRKHLVEIDTALKRIMDGGYGDCFECGEPIKPGRLAANPATRLCIACAEELE
jgi:DnaK suppressor protein